MATPTPVIALVNDPSATTATTTPAVSSIAAAAPAIPSSSSPATNVTVGKARSTDGSAAAAASSKAQYVRDSTRALLLWENPLHSGAVLSAIVAANYVLTHYSPVSVVSSTLAAVTLANLLFVNLWTYGGSLFTNSVGNGGVKKPPTMWFLDHANRQPLSHSFIREWSDLFVDIVNVSISSIASIVAVDDSLKSLEALFGFGFVYLLSRYISSGTLFLVATIIGFVAPRLYLANKDFVDGHVHRTRGIVNGHVQTLTGTATAYFNDASAKAKAKVAQVNQKVKKAE